MKKIIISGITATLLSLSAQAQPLHHMHKGHWHRAPGGGWYWVPALVVGGIAGAVIARENQTPVIVHQPPTVYVECTEWKEIQTNEGKIYRERSCTQKVEPTK